MNNTGMLQALAFEPRKAFLELDARPRFWWPLLLLTLGTVAINAWYTSIVDLEWLTDQQLRNNPMAQNMTSAEIERLARDAASRRGLNVVIGTVGTLVVLPVILLVSALYYSLAGKITAVERSFRHWLALSAWSTMPTLLTLLASAVVLLTAGSSQISQADLQPLSLNALLFRREQGEPGFALFTSLNLVQFLSLYLAAFGVRVWSNRSWLFSIVFTALPYVLIYGIWAFFALRST